MSSKPVLHQLSYPLPYVGGLPLLGNIFVYLEYKSEAI